MVLVAPIRRETGAGMAVRRGIGTTVPSVRRETGTTVLNVRRADAADREEETIWAAR